ncbi:xyloglucan galactosyltransferase XLT2-like [Salvia hispanica]|uniref:xyloglucan galactosyltransferase XLT2-like n=1 Tax=Salvia hispanica TaxID=49212 RepID=UPI002009665F|nr:xyloglucan galactosyltransferase XLT2-like [Salvia hispanica]
MTILKNLRPKPRNKLHSILLILFLFQIYYLSSIFYTPQSLEPLEPWTRCDRGLVYVYDLPPAFNTELLHNCRDLGPWKNSRCDALSNGGFGPRTTTPAWYWTDMLTGDVMYHARVLKHRCRTTEPGSATAFFIPFYAGVVAGKALFTNDTPTNRDRQFDELLTWLQDQPLWRRSNGSDHFIHIGRPTWDLRRRRDEHWGISFIYMPAMEQIMRLTVERALWDHHDIGVPYPTGFHPKSKLELDQWLHFVTNRKRSSLFTFVGAKRNKIKDDFRSILLSHCYNESASCRVVDCSISECHGGTPEIQEAFLDSDFCLQPKGDTYTRRSIFDCMLAGSIPVFFWRESIAGQYDWFLGDEPDRLSVFIDRKDVRNGTSIRKVLEGYSKEEVRRLRDKVISLIPNFIYGDGSGIGKDAFDISLDGVLKRIKGQNKNIR